jgi:hypothetical protein
MLGNVDPNGILTQGIRRREEKEEQEGIYM